MRQIGLDTETTGLSTEQGHRIIEIGCLEIVDRRLTGREYHRFLNPDRDIDEGAEAVHGISRASLENEPRFHDIADEFLAFIADAEIVAHNAEFDIGFLDHELRLIEHPQPAITNFAKVLDTLTLARELHPGQRNSLDALCKRYEIDASKREVHGALIDAELLARVYLAMTGGQTDLLLDDARGDQEDTDAVATVRKARNDLSLIVVRARDEEVEAHEAMLEKLRDGGSCVWDQLT